MGIVQGINVIPSTFSCDRVIYWDLTTQGKFLLTKLSKRLLNLLKERNLDII